MEVEVSRARVARAFGWALAALCAALGVWVGAAALNARHRERGRAALREAALRLMNDPRAHGSYKGDSIARSLPAPICDQAPDEVHVGPDVVHLERYGEVMTTLGTIVTLEPLEEEALRRRFGLSKHVWRGEPCLWEYSQ